MADRTEFACIVTALGSRQASDIEGDKETYLDLADANDVILDFANFVPTEPDDIARAIQETFVWRTYQGVSGWRRFDHIIIYHHGVYPGPGLLRRWPPQIELIGPDEVFRNTAPYIAGDGTLYICACYQTTEKWGEWAIACGFTQKLRLWPGTGRSFEYPELRGKFIVEEEPPNLLQWFRSIFRK